MTLVRGEWPAPPAAFPAFPHLEELALIDAAPAFLHFHHTAPDTPRFPALKRLHTAEHAYARPLDFGAWARHAPALTHLRCSRLHHRDSPTARTLAATCSTCCSYPRPPFLLQVRSRQYPTLLL